MIIFVVKKEIGIDIYLLESTIKQQKQQKLHQITSNVIVERNIKKEPHYGGINKSVNIKKSNIMTTITI